MRRTRSSGLGLGPWTVLLVAVGLVLAIAAVSSLHAAQFPLDGAAIARFLRAG